MALRRPHVAQRREDVGFQVLGFVGVAQNRKQIGKTGSQAAIADELYQQFPYIPWRRFIPEKARDVRRPALIRQPRIASGE